MAITGLGFSGTMVLAHLVNSAQPPKRIALIDPSPKPWRGLAYSTHHPAHLLNVRARAMSAYGGDADHFLRWLHAQKEYAGFRADDFVPRRIYGDYLESIARTALEKARARQIEIVHLHASLRTIGGGNPHHQLTLEGGAQLSARALVLATGNRFDEAGEGAATRHPWHISADDWKHGKHGRIVLVGAGLTAMDMAASLLADGYSGEILMLSRHGLNPHAHNASKAGDVDALLAHLMRGGLSARLFALRRAMREGTQDWRSIIDGLRGHTPIIWQSLNAQDQQRFLSRLLSFWNIHRHRMDATQRARILAAPNVRHQRGQVLKASAHHVQLRHSSREQRIDADVVLDCRGPSYRALIPALADASAGELIACHPQGGLISNDAYRVNDPSCAPIYALGALLFGERFETTAVPELRVQAEELAKILAPLS